MNKKLNLQMFATNSISRSDADALIPTEVMKEIIQNVTEQSTVLKLGKNYKICHEIR